MPTVFDVLGLELVENGCGGDLSSCLELPCLHEPLGRRRRRLGEAHVIDVEEVARLSFRIEQHGEAGL